MALEAFFQMPMEVAEMILYDAAIEPQVIEAQFDREPHLRRRAKDNHEYIIWSYRMQARDPSALLSVDRNTRKRFLCNNPNVLQLNHGPKIHFNAERDTIYFDSESFLNLWQYVKKHGWQFANRALRDPMIGRGGPNIPGTPWGNLKGFQLIQTLGWFRKDPATLHLRGLADLMRATQKGLTGLTNVRLLGHRGNHPGGRAPNTFNGAARQLDRRFLWAARQKITALRNS